MRSAFVTTDKGEKIWVCPGCGGDCFGSSHERWHCGGNSFGTPSEQTPGCGYWQDWPEGGLGTSRSSPWQNGINTDQRKSFMRWLRQVFT